MLVRSYIGTYFDKVTLKFAIIDSKDVWHKSEDRINFPNAVFVNFSALSLLFSKNVSKVAFVHSKLLLLFEGYLVIFSLSLPT